jgi:hypothetical protein
MLDYFYVKIIGLWITAVNAAVYELESAKPQRKGHQSI